MINLYIKKHGNEKYVDTLHECETIQDTYNFVRTHLERETTLSENEIDKRLSLRTNEVIFEVEPILYEIYKKERFMYSKTEDVILDLDNSVWYCLDYEDENDFKNEDENIHGHLKQSYFEAISEKEFKKIIAQKQLDEFMTW